jgi:hypothetical protein
MIDIHLRNKPIQPGGKYTPVTELPAVIYGTVIRDEYDNQRLVCDEGKYISHNVVDRVDGTRKPLHLCGVSVNQPLLAMKVLNDVTCDITGNSLTDIYPHLLEKFNLSCDECIKYLDIGCLPINGKYIEHLTENQNKKVLLYEFDKAEWYNRFAPMNVYILY